MPMPALAPVERPPWLWDALGGSEALVEVEVGSAVFHLAMSEPCQATTTVGANKVRAFDGTVVGVPSKFTDVPTDVQDKGSPQKVSPLLGFTVLSANPLQSRQPFLRFETFLDDPPWTTYGSRSRLVGSCSRRRIAAHARGRRVDVVLLLLDCALPFASIWVV